MCYFSVVLTGRNDNHCHGFLTRLQTTINMYGYFADLFDFKFELVIVEWYPLNDILFQLSQVLSNPSSNLNVRIITVLKSVHNQIETTIFDAVGADDMDFFLGIAQNVGLRRANGQFLMATNADIIPNQSLIEFISQQQLSDKSFYRTYRYDMDFVLPNINCIDNLTTCEKYAKLRGSKVKEVTNLIHKKAAGDFILAHKDIFNQVKGFPEIRCDGLKIDGEILDRMSFTFSQIILDDPIKIFHQYHESRYISEYNRKTTVRRFGKTQVSLKFRSDRLSLYTNTTTINQNRATWGLSDHVFKESLLCK